MVHPTTEDIAKKLGISRGTVSRVLNNHGRVSEDTCRKVLEAVDQLNYSPNKAARALAMNRSFKIAVIFFSEPIYYWNHLQLGVNRAYDELKHFGLEVRCFITDIKRPEEQVSLMEQLANEDFDAIAVAPNDPLIMDEVIDKLSDKGLPILVFNSDVPSSKRFCYIGCNYVKGGRLAGELMGKMLNGSGKVAILTISNNIISIQQRIIGFREAIAEFPHIEMSGPYRLNRTGEDAYGFTRELVRQNDGLDGIFVSFGILDDVARALLDENKQGRIKVVGYDISESISEYLRQNIIHSVITHEPFTQGYISVKILYRLLYEGTRPAQTIINTRLEAVFKENLEYFTGEQEHYEILFK